jgi:hypothetical protein
MFVKASSVGCGSLVSCIAYSQTGGSQTDAYAPKASKIGTVAMFRSDRIGTRDVCEHE